MYRVVRSFIGGISLFLFALFIISAVNVHVSYSVALSTALDAVKSSFPGASDIKKETKTLTDEEKKNIEKKADIEFNDEFDKEFTFYIVYSGEKVEGYAVENTVKGKWGPIHFIVAIATDGTVKDVVILEYTERRGKPVAGEKFRHQFYGKSVSDDVNIRKDINAVSGATISSRGVTDGVRKLLHVFHKFYGTGV